MSGYGTSGTGVGTGVGLVDGHVGRQDGEGPEWVLLSAHHTSEGLLEYCACVCGCVVVLLAGEIVKRIPGHGSSA
jgi:hypothetical protein